jgi:hypothetical protein
MPSQLSSFAGILETRYYLSENVVFLADEVCVPRGTCICPFFCRGFLSSPRHCRAAKPITA